MFCLVVGKIVCWSKKNIAVRNGVSGSLFFL